MKFEYSKDNLLAVLNCYVLVGLNDDLQRSNRFLWQCEANLNRHLRNSLDLGESFEEFDATTKYLIKLVEDAKEELNMLTQVKTLWNEIKGVN